MADDEPYCGAELLPHATAPDGSAAPILCTLPVHGRYSRHRNEDLGTEWQWQDAAGNWITPPGGTSMSRRE